MNGTLTVANTAQLEAENTRIVMRAQALKITDAKGHERAQEMLIEIATSKKGVEAFFGPTKEHAYDTWKAAIAMEKTFLEPLDIARKTVLDTVNAYEQIQRELAAARQAALEEDARNREAAQAISHAIASDQSISLSHIDEVIDIPIVHVAANVAVVKGVTTTKRYLADCTDLLALAKFVVANPQMLGLLEVNQSALNKLAASMRERFALPGCALRVEHGKTVRTR